MSGWQRIFQYDGQNHPQGCAGHVHSQIQKAGVARWYPKLKHLDGCGERRTDEDGRGDRQPAVSAAAEREVSREPGRDVDHEIHRDIAEQKVRNTGGPGMEKNPERTVRQRDRNEMPRVEASVGDQRQNRDEKREQPPLLAIQFLANPRTLI